LRYGNFLLNSLRNVPTFLLPDTDISVVVFFAAVVVFFAAVVVFFATVFFATAIIVDF
jgi:hypothetical protein